MADYEITERCKDCCYCYEYRRFSGKGFEKVGFCCTYFSQIENGPVDEIKETDFCECWKPKGE
ncbi:MAG: hypothetical protein IJ306_01100 [Oscillospiraceae bacterium]|nr:hypothetical protein [Oscillospiraceae bacterium]